MNQDLAAELRTWKSECISKEFVFPARGGRPRVNPSNNDNALLGAAAKAAGIQKHVTPHVLRHSFATLAYQSTPDLDATRRLMRHSSITTTMRYIHDVRSLRENVDALPSMIPSRKLKSV
jgi:integrase